MIRKLVCSMFVLTLSAGLVTADEFYADPTKVDGDKVTFQKIKGAKFTEKDGDSVTLPIAKDAKVLMRIKSPPQSKSKGEKTKPVEGGLKNELFNNIPQNGAYARFTTSEDKKSIIDITVLGFRSDPLPKEIVQPWMAAGGKFGSSDTYYAGRPAWLDRELHGTMSMPAFYFPEPNEGMLAKLPHPKTPFGLFLRRETVTDADMKDIARLAHLKILSLVNTKVTDEGLKELAALKNLRSLEIVSFNVTDVGLKHLGGLKRLEALNLRSTGLTDQGLKELAGLQNLQTLSLRSSAVTDAGLKELAGLKSLVWLDLYNTKVTDKGLKELVTLKYLQEVDLEICKEVTMAGVQELQTALPDCRIRSPFSK